MIRQLRSGLDGHGDGIRVLAVTAQTGTGARDTALSAGADQFMTKPFAMGQLLYQARALTWDARHCGVPPRPVPNGSAGPARQS